MSTTKDLADFYNKEAFKYYLSRKKYWSDGKIILQYFSKIHKKNLRVLELWCWGWRWLTLLKENIQTPFSYIWIDISRELLNLAKKDYPEAEFVCDDMFNYLSKSKQESFDCVLWFACFQHIDNEKERFEIMKDIYKSLSYWWELIFTNRSLSYWFLKKYWETIIVSRAKSFFSLWKYSWRDIYIPWTSENGKQYRYYHLFWLNELKILAERSWFSVEECCYLDKNWEKISSRKNSHNSFLVARKWIFK